MAIWTRALEPEGKSKELGNSETPASTWCLGELSPTLTYIFQEEKALSPRATWKKYSLAQHTNRCKHEQMGWRPHLLDRPHLGMTKPTGVILVAETKLGLLSVPSLESWAGLVAHAPICPARYLALFPVHRLSLHPCVPLMNPFCKL